MKLFLLGKFELLSAGGTPLPVRSDREQALLAYLAVERRQPHRREFLASLLWPEVTEEQARNSLRVNLHRLRKTLEDQAQQENIVLATRETVQFNPQTNVWIDASVFLELVGGVEAHTHKSLEDCAACLADLEEAAFLYQGTLLGGWSLFDSQPYNEWLLLKQEWLHRRALDALSLLTDSYERRAQWTQAESYARRQLELEPWREEAHRQLMHILAKRGERTAALAQYEIGQRALMEELGVAPSSETADLYQRIRDGEVETGAEKRSSPRMDDSTTAAPEEKPALGQFRRWKRSGIVGLLAIAVLFSIYLVVAARRSSTDQIPGSVALSSTLVVYDDFGRVEFDGLYDEDRWFEISDLPQECPLSQTGGILQIMEHASQQQCGNKLRIRKPLNTSGARLGGLQARLNLTDAHNGGTAATVLSWVANFPNGAWIADCGIFGDTGAISVSFVVSDTRPGAQPDGQPLHLSSVPIHYDTWYAVRLHLTPETMEVSCWVDRQEVSRFSPDDPGELRTAPFIQEINSWRLPDAVGTVLVDDVAFAVSE